MDNGPFVAVSVTGPLPPLANCVLESMVEFVTVRPVRLSLAVIITAPPAPAKSDDVLIVELIKDNGPFVAVSVTGPLSPLANCVLESMVEFVKDADSVAVTLTAPPWPPPVVVLRMEAPSILKFPVRICTSPPGSAPTFDETIELFGLSTMVSGETAF